MDRPPLDATQAQAAVDAYYLAREQAVRYVLSLFDRDSPASALPYLEVLQRVQALLTIEIGRYTTATTPPAVAEGAEA